MLFPFTPANLETANEAMALVYSGFTPEQLDEIRCIGDGLESTSLKLYGKFDDSMVKARGAHLHLTDDTRWIYEQLATTVRDANAENWDYSLSGFAENFYCLSYSETEHFGWHVDAGHLTPAPRKLSGVLQLSSPDEYEGGELEIRYGPRALRTTKAKGLLTLFPSGSTHRVTPVTSGVRRVLTLFAAGPHLR